MYLSTSLWPCPLKVCKIGFSYTAVQTVRVILSLYSGYIILLDIAILCISCSVSIKFHRQKEQYTSGGL